MEGLPKDLPNLSQAELEEAILRERIFLWLFTRFCNWRKSIHGKGFELYSTKENYYLGKVWFHNLWISAPYNSEVKTFDNLEDAAKYLEGLYFYDK
jgi:hypothetical protein